LVALALIFHVLSAFVTFGASTPENAYSFLFWGMFLFAFAIPLPFPIVLLTAVGAGVGLDYFYVLWMTTVQTKVPEEALSRVNSFDGFGQFLLGPLGIALAGPLVLIYGLQPTMLISAAIALLGILATFLVPSVRRLEAETYSNN
jgi:MFS family permease